MTGYTAARHTSPGLMVFLVDIAANQPRGNETHVIGDNPSAHKIKVDTEFLATRPKVHMHVTPTYSSWLKQVRTLIRQDRALSNRADRVHIIRRDRKEADALHPQTQQASQTGEVEMLGIDTRNHWRFYRYRPPGVAHMRCPIENSSPDSAALNYGWADCREP